MSNDRSALESRFGLLQLVCMVAAETNGTASNEPILFYFIQMSIDRLEQTLCSPERELNAYGTDAM